MRRRSTSIRSSRKFFGKLVKKIGGAVKIVAKKAIKGVAQFTLGPAPESHQGRSSRFSSGCSNGPLASCRWPCSPWRNALFRNSASPSRRRRHRRCRRCRGADFSRYVAQGRRLGWIGRRPGCPDTSAGGRHRCPQLAVWREYPVIPVKCIGGGGTSAASLAMKSSGSSAMCVVPSRYGVSRV